MELERSLWRYLAKNGKKRSFRLHGSIQGSCIQCITRAKLNTTFQLYELTIYCRSTQQQKKSLDTPKNSRHSAECLLLQAIKDNSALFKILKCIIPTLFFQMKLTYITPENVPSTAVDDAILLLFSLISRPLVLNWYHRSTKVLFRLRINYSHNSRSKSTIIT